MTVRIVEALTQGTDVWTPIVVGNASGERGIRYIAVLPRADATKQTPIFKTITFLKDGSASDSDTTRQQLKCAGASQQLHKMAKALNVEYSDYQWNRKQIDRESLRLLSFANHTDLNAYLLNHSIKPVVSGTEATIVTEVVIPEAQTVAELYQELGKIIATNPKAGSAKAVVTQSLTDFKLTDDQIKLLQRNIQASLIKNAAANIAKQLEAKANVDIVKLYQAFDVKNPPVIKLTSEILPAAPKAKK